MNSSDASWQSVFDLPEDSSPKVDVVLHQPHPTIFGPAFPVVVANHVLIVGIRVFCEVSLDEFPSFVTGEFEENVEMVDISEIDPDGMFGFQFNGLEDHELVLIERRPSHFIRPVDSDDEDVDDHGIELEDEGSELQSHQQSVVVGMVHVFEVDDHVVLGSHVVSDVVIHYQSQQPIQESQVNLLIDLVQSGLHQH